MASSILDLYNLAVSHLGVSIEIQSLTESSATLKACNRFYQQTHDEVLGSFPWPFATRTVQMALVEEDPTPEWAYSYQIPSNCLSFRRVLSTIETTGAPTTVYTRNPVLTQVIPFRRVGQLVYCDWPDAMGEYTVQSNDPTVFEALFTQAIALKMAAYMAPRLTGGDPFKLGNAAAVKYLSIIQQAMANAANESIGDPPPESSFILARDSYASLYDIP